MKLKLVAQTIGMTAAAAMLASCSGIGAQSPQIGTETFQGLRGAPSLLRVNLLERARPDLRKTWISPDAKSARALLFLSDQIYGDVYIYSWPNLKLKGTISGLDAPQGECTDRRGDVYVVDSGSVLEYSHAGDLINTYINAYGQGAGCAVNPTNGHLAVTNIGSRQVSGSLLIFSSTSAPPKVIQNSDEQNYYFTGYDPHGRLWEDGSNASGQVILWSCSEKRCKTVYLLNGKIWMPGAVQWNEAAKTMVVFDQDCNGASLGGACSYPVSTNGILGTQTSYSSAAGGSLCDLIQAAFTPDGKSVAGADSSFCGLSPTAYGWGYPGGGKPVRDAVLPNPYSIMVGAAISTKS